MAYINLCQLLATIILSSTSLFTTDAALLDLSGGGQISGLHFRDDDSASEALDNLPRVVYDKDTRKFNIYADKIVFEQHVFIQGLKAATASPSAAPSNSPTSRTTAPSAATIAPTSNPTPAPLFFTNPAVTAATSFTRHGVNFNLPEKIKLAAKVTTGDTVASGGIMIMGQSGSQGNMYLWISSSSFFAFGVQSTSGFLLNDEVTVSPNTYYELEATWDGSQNLATLSVNGTMVEASVSLNYVQAITYVTLGSGDITNNAVEPFDFGVIHWVSVGTF